MAQTSRVTGSCTDVFTDDAGALNVTYRGTRVVTAGEGKIVLRTGGWRTNTTRARMNQASNQFGLGYQVYQKDFEWFVSYKGETVAFNDDTLELTR